jgi:hypothetical protein
MRALVVALALVPLAAAADECEERLQRDTEGCCWPGQEWSAPLRACVGAPACPAGFVARGEACFRDCKGGLVADEDTGGHCCWPEQVWSQERGECVGTPACPAGMSAYGERCVPGCVGGRVANEDTAGHCCWPGQAWSRRRGACVGTPRCLRDWFAVGETCAPRPPSADRATVTFLADRGEHFRVQAQGQSCQTPCDLELNAGRVRLELSGTRDFSYEVTIAPGATTARIHLSRRWQYTGFAGFALGIGLLLGGYAYSTDYFHDGGGLAALVVAGFLALGSGVTVLCSGGSTEIVLERPQPITVRQVPLSD